ncbi:hypothetical protein T439DRAFT_135117 [Meredithblackwellia eburnea MCA 4105]
MMREVAKQAYTLAKAGGSDKPHTAVTAWIDTLCAPKYEEDDFEGIPELVESINLQNTGPTEASRAIRKKLKYSDIHGQLRALTILKALVENCGHRFQVTFGNERLVDRIKLMAGDPLCDAKVKTKLMSVLRSWHVQFKDDPKMQTVASLYLSCGGGKKVVTRTEATAAYENRQAEYEREAQARADRKAKEREAARLREDERMAKELAAKEAKKAKKKGPTPKRAPFNFEAEKPKIMASVGQGTQSAQALINALQHVNREKESVETNPKVQECLTKAKADRKSIVRFIQLVENDASGDFIGALLATNEQILTAIALYDRMSKPVELDSDDEHIAEMKSSAQKQGLKVPEPDGDTASIRSRLSAFELKDSQLDRLQLKQRARVERVNRARTQGVHPDLQDLAFGSTAGSSSLQSPIEPSEEPTMSHSLADYSDGSDFSSSDGEYYSGAPPTSASSSAGNAHPNINARSYAQYIQQEDEQTGKGKGLLEEEEDPFADPFDDDDDDARSFSVHTPGIAEKQRMEWKEI